MKPDNSEGEARRSLVRFGGMAFQMGIIIALFAFLGQWFDKKYQTEDPWFTILLSLLGIGASLYLMFREIGKS
jgi:F0F1-type ATP synthase assembly protein I